MNAKIVIGLGFGDEGKGLTTDYLCQQSDKPIVIRFNGGQQAGHTVLKDGVRHVHSNFGSGTLRGVPSYFTEHTSVYLNTMQVEYGALKDKGVNPELYVHPLTKLTTPYDVAWNRMTESKNRHGSCGLGVAATMKRNWESPYKLYAVDLTYKKVFNQKLDSIAQYYRELLKTRTSEEHTLFYDLMVPEMVKFVQNMENPIFNVMDYGYLTSFEDLIFEGAQGIMLDMEHGVFPNVTCSHTTSKNALEICQKFDIYAELFYITRCYQTRHGNGWMSPTGDIELINNEHETNVSNPWQGDFRIGELDYDLLNHALAIDNVYSVNQSKTLVVTCLDQRPEFKFEYGKIDFPVDDTIESYSADGEQMKIFASLI